MPYPGVPKGSQTEAKIERCVEEVMKKNPSYSKSKAIAICRASIEKKETTMAKTKGGQTARQRRKDRRREDEELLKTVNSGIPLDELYDEELDMDEEILPPDTLDDLTEALDGEDNLIATMAVDLDEPETDEKKEITAEVEEIHADDPAPVEPPPPTVDVKSRVRELIDLPDEPEVEETLDPFDFDLASIDMLLALSESNPITKVGDWIAKAVLTSSARTSLKDRDFALVVERDGKKVRKYPVHDKAHVRNALARAAQMIKRGGQAASDARAALPKIRAAAKKFGIGKPSKKHSNAIVVHKETDGSYRYIGWLSGKWIDREKEILSEQSHKEFVEFVEAHPEWKIDFRSWHMPGTERSHPVDFWTYENGFVIVSGILTEPEAVRLMKAMQKQPIGMSHGFFGVRDLTDERIIRKYRTFEISDLPLDHAAFPWSDLTTLMEAKSMKTQLQYLSDTVGEDRLKAILEDTELKKQLLERTGIEEKAFDAFLAGEDIEEPVEETKETDEQDDAPELSEEMVSLLKSSLGLEGVDLVEIREMLEKSNATAALLPVLMQKIDDLSAQLAEEKKSADEQLAEMLSGSIKGRKSIQNARATSQDGNEPDEELAKSIPTHENSWLAELAGVQPEQ